MKQNTSVLLMDIKRFQRLYSREKFPEMVATYVNDRYYPKVAGISQKKKTIAPPAVTEDMIKAVIVNHFGFTWEKLGKKDRSKDLTHARQVGMYLLVTRTKLTLKKIGEMFHRDHTTVIHARQVLKDRMDKDDSLRKQIEFLQEQI